MLHVYEWFVAQVGYMSATDVSLIQCVQVLWERKQRTNKLRNRSKGVDPYQVPDPYLVLLMCLLVPCVTCSCMVADLSPFALHLICLTSGPRKVDARRFACQHTRHRRCRTMVALARLYCRETRRHQTPFG